MSEEVSSEAGRDSEEVGEDLLAALRIELANERARKASIESRAMTLGAGAAAGIALVLGLASDYVGRWEKLSFALLAYSGGLFLLAAAITASDPGYPQRMASDDSRRGYAGRDGGDCSPDGKVALVARAWLVLPPTRCYSSVTQRAPSYPDRGQQQGR